MSDEPRCEVCGRGGTETTWNGRELCPICVDNRSEYALWHVEAKKARLLALAEWDAAHPARFPETKGDAK